MINLPDLSEGIKAISALSFVGIFTAGLVGFTVKKIMQMIMKA